MGWKTEISECKKHLLEIPDYHDSDAIILQIKTLLQVSCFRFKPPWKKSSLWLRKIGNSIIVVNKQTNYFQEYLNCEARNKIDSSAIDKFIKCITRQVNYRDTSNFSEHQDSFARNVHEFSFDYLQNEALDGHLDGRNLSCGYGVKRVWMSTQTIGKSTDKFGPSGLWCTDQNW